MSSPRVNGPRSLIFTIVVAPVRGFVTFTRVPNGSFLCAAVRLSGRNGSPLAVPNPELYWVAFIEPLRQTSWVDAARTALPKHIETSNTGRVRISLTGMIYLLLRRLSDTVSRNGEQGRQWKTENQNDLLNVVLCDKPEIRTAAAATDRDDLR
jgi:hypothetical protein